MQNAPENFAAAADAEPAVGAAPAAATAPAADVLRDYGQRLTDALRAKGQALATEPARRRALWPVAVAALAGLLAARDVLTPNGPASASAATRSQASSAAARGTSGKTAAPAAAAAGTSAKPSSLRSWLDEPVAPVERNIFATSGPAARKAAESVALEAKSAPEAADANERRDAVSAPSPSPEVPGRSAAASGESAGGSSNVQARQFRLQSTLMGGPRPAALVNGQMVREGDVVATGSGASRTSYRVLKIEARRVILEREGIRSEIPID